MIELRVDTQGIDEIIARLAPTEKQADAALKTTLNKMSKWLQTRTARALSAELLLQQKIIRRRMRKSSIEKSANGWSVKLWYGLNDVSYMALGARQTKKGVTAGKHKLPHAWIAKKQVFKRVGKARLPIEKQTLVIKQQADATLQNMVDSLEFEQQFMKTLEHEIRWRMFQFAHLRGATSSVITHS